MRTSLANLMLRVVLVDKDEALPLCFDRSRIMDLGRTDAATINREFDYLWGRSWSYLHFGAWLILHSLIAF
jgi:hypothetical protein